MTNILVILMFKFDQWTNYGREASQKPGNTEQGKCWLTNEYPFFLFLIGSWYYEKNISYL